MTIRTQLKAGRAYSFNHNEALRVRSAVKAAGIESNHNEALTVRSNVKAGGLESNHSDMLRVRSTVKAGACTSGEHFPTVKI